MKKVLLSTAMVAVGLTAQADGYSHLTLETANGEKTSVAVEQLTLTISDGKLTVGDKTFLLTDLSKMYFTTENVTAIDSMESLAEDGTVEVFNLQGMQVGQFESLSAAHSSLQHGIYVFKTANKTFKVCIK